LPPLFLSLKCSSSFPCFQGKLPFAVGKALEDYPSGGASIVTDDVLTPTANFSEGVYVDYKVRSTC
jgi:hypothetical protein